MSPQGDMVIILAQNRFASIILARDYDAWCEDPGNFASCVVTSTSQIDLLVIAIAANARFVLEEKDAGLLLTFRLPNGLTLAVPVSRAGDVVPIDADYDLVALPRAVVNCAVTIQIGPDFSGFGLQHGDN